MKLSPGLPRSAASKAGDFYACPGVEFTDVLGNRWAAWGTKVIYPPDVFRSRQLEMCERVSRISFPIHFNKGFQRIQRVLRSGVSNDVNVNLVTCGIYSGEGFP